MYLDEHDDEPMASIYLSAPVLPTDEDYVYRTLFGALGGVEVGIGHDYVNVYSDDTDVIGKASGLLIGLGYVVTEIAGG